MADLNRLYPTGNAVNLTSNWGVPGGGAASIDEDPASPDGLEVGDDTNATIDVYAYFALSDVNADLGILNTLNGYIGYRVTGAQSNNRSLYLQVMTDESTPVNLTNEITVATNITATARQDSGARALTIQGTPSKEQLNNAVVRLRLNVTKNKSGDSNGIRVDYVSFAGTYTIQTGLAISVNGIVWASIANVNGIAVASIANVSGAS